MPRAQRSERGRGTARRVTREALQLTAAKARRRLSLNLKKERARLSLSQERAAEAADFSLQYYQRIERQIVNAPLDTIARLAFVFGVEPHELLAPVVAAK